MEGLRSDIRFSIDGEHFEKIGHVSDIELTAEEEEIAERLFVSDSFEFSIPESESDKLLRSVLGQSSYNSMKLKQDGYLSPKNGWFTPIESPAIGLTEEITKEIRRKNDKERERSIKSGIEE